MSDRDDNRFMMKAIRLAKKGMGNTSPNPLVGAILVNGGEVVGRGYHKKYGEAHAEINAISDARGRSAGTTLYCNLEPCVHTDKQTPPCVPAIIKAGIRRVVIANLDPNQKVNGKGVNALRKAGLEVDTGICKTSGLDLNRFYFKYIDTALPYITVKYAQTLDGYIARDRHRQDWISGDKARKKVHQLRACFDAILVGAQTLRTDNPQLTVRQVRGRDPLRIILSASLNFDQSLKIFHEYDGAKTWIFTTDTTERSKIQILEDLGCRVIPIKHMPGNRVDIRDVLHVLADQRIISLLVEGGQDIISQFIFRHLADELKIIISPKLWGQGLGALSETGDTLRHEYNLHHSELLDSDLMLTLRPIGSIPAGFPEQPHKFL